MEGYFFFSSSFFFFFFFLIFFFFSSLFLSPGMCSVPGRAHFLPIMLFFSFLLFPLFYTSFFPPFLSYSNFFLPLSPCLPFYFFAIFLLSILVCFISSPVHQSTFITIPRSQINVINIIFTINVRPHKLTLLFHIPART